MAVHRIAEVQVEIKIGRIGELNGSKRFTALMPLPSDKNILSWTYDIVIGIRPFAAGS